VFEHLRLPGNLSQHWYASSQRIRLEFGYSEPVPIEEGLRQTIAWERQTPPSFIDLAKFDYEAEDRALES
jgi:nucleoside-diphosphate-sugar epimerase